MNAQKGFTLIELMIVIAIIGILAAIALPAYQDYTARAQASEPLKAGAGIQTDIATYYSENKAFPPAGHDIMTSTSALSGKYFPASGMVLTAGTGVLTTTFNNGANSGSTLILTPIANSANGQIQKWVCTGTIGANRIPSGCK